MVHRLGSVHRAPSSSLRCCTHIRLDESWTGMHWTGPCAAHTRLSPIHCTWYAKLAQRTCCIMGPAPAQHYAYSMGPVQPTPLIWPVGSDDLDINDLNYPDNIYTDWTNKSQYFCVLALLPVHQVKRRNISLQTTLSSLTMALQHLCSSKGR